MENRARSFLLRHAQMVGLEDSEDSPWCRLQRIIRFGCLFCWLLVCIVVFVCLVGCLVACWIALLFCLLVWFVVLLQKVL